MEYISIGNIIGLQWSVEYYGGGEFPLEDCAVRLFMVTSRGRSEITDFSTSGNTASWTFDTVDQYAGSYSFIMVISDGGKLNSRMVWDHALRLSSYSGANSTDMILTHTSSLDVLSTAVAQFTQLSPEQISTSLTLVTELKDKTHELEGRVSALEDTDFEAAPVDDDTDYPEVNE